LKFLCGTGFECVYDDDYNQDVRKAIDSKLKGCVIVDTPRREILQTGNELLIHGSQSGQVLSALEVSPVLKNLQGVSIHKLRYYAPVDVAPKVRVEIRKICKGIGGGTA
jgi:hypothetical protein